MLELLLWVHIAAGIASIPLGTIAVAARKGGWLHARAGTGLLGSMLVLGPGGSWRGGETEGSFLLGQQDALPVALRGSPITFVLAFAPLAVMAFWLVRLRFAKALGKLTLRLRPVETPSPLKMEI